MEAQKLSSEKETDSIQSDDKPSIFDILSHENLNSSMKNGVKSLIKVLATWFPNQLYAQVYKRFDELFLIFYTLLEGHHIYKYGASFTEKFYGMKRIQIPAKFALFGFLGWRSKSLILLVLLPYLIAKLERLHNKLQYSSDDTKGNLLAKLFVFLYPYFRVVGLSAALLFHVSYAFSLTNVQSLSLYLSGARLVKENFDLVSITRDDEKRGGVFAKLFETLFSFIGRVFTYSLFLVQFSADRYYSDDAKFGLVNLARRAQRQAIFDETQLLSKLEPRKCPICYKSNVYGRLLLLETSNHIYKIKRQNDTALAVSGYVFCYSCIFNFVRMNGRCPVTLLPASTDQLIKLY